MRAPASLRSQKNTICGEHTPPMPGCLQREEKNNDRHDIWAAAAHLQEKGGDSPAPHPLHHHAEAFLGAGYRREEEEESHLLTLLPCFWKGSGVSFPHCHCAVLWASLMPPPYPSLFSPFLPQFCAFFLAFTLCPCPCVCVDLGFMSGMVSVCM